MWMGNGSDTLWSTPENWENSTLPTAEESLAFRQENSPNKIVTIDSAFYTSGTIDVGKGSSAENPYIFEATDPAYGLTIQDDVCLGYNEAGWLWIKSGTYVFGDTSHGMQIGENSNSFWLKVGDGTSTASLTAKTKDVNMYSGSVLVADKATLDIASSYKSFVLNNSSAAHITNSTVTFGSVRLKGTSSMTASGSAITVGYDLNVADENGANCSLSGVSSTINLTSKNNVFNVGQGANSTGVVTKDGGDWSCYYLRLGNASGATGTFTHNDGTLEVKTELSIGAKGTGTFTMNGGTVTLNSGANQFIGKDSGSSGTLNLNGGTFTARCLRRNNDGATATLNFNGGTLKSNYADARGLIASGVTTTVLAGGGTIDSGNKEIYVVAAIGGTGAMRFKGGSSITLSGENTYSSGTTIELGTKVVASDATAKDTILGNLVIDGRSKLNPTDYVVFEYSAGGLTDTDLANVSFTNCAAGTTSKIVDGNKIVVTLAAESCVPKTPNTLKVFDSKTLADIAFAEFSSRMCGASVDSSFNAPGSAKGYNKKMTFDENGIASIIVEFQVYDDGYTKCVVVEITNGDGGVYATVLGAANVKRNDVGRQFYTGSGTAYNQTVAEEISGRGYGVCDIRWTPGEKSAWTLDTDKNWSDFEGYGSLNPDEAVSIYATGNFTLTMDVDAAVAGIALFGAGGATLSVASGKALTVGDISGIGNIVNKGTVVKTGDGTVAWPFDNASTGVTIVSNGTLKVASVKTVSNNPYGFKPDGENHEVRVATGATFDLNGIKELTVSVRLAESATFANYGAAIDSYKMQTVQIILDGNATAAFSNDFGLIAPGCKESKLDLGSNTLTLDGAGKNFWLCNTTISGTGTIEVSHGYLNLVRASTGEYCTLKVLNGGALILGANLTVKNFENGTVDNITGTSTLTVKGTLTPGTKAIPKLTLASGATVKATGTVQVVSTEFSASGTITVDASAISAAALREAGETGVAVLTVPAAFNPLNAKWDVSGEQVPDTRRKWRTDVGGTTKTLYVAKPSGLMVIIR